MTHSDSDLSENFDADSWLSSTRTLPHENDPYSTYGSPQSSSRKPSSKSTDNSPAHGPSSAKLPPPLASLHSTMHHANTAPCLHAAPAGSSRHNLVLYASLPTRPASPSSRPLEIELLPAPQRRRSASLLQCRCGTHDAIASQEGAADPQAVRRRSQSPKSPTLRPTSAHQPTFFPPHGLSARRLSRSPAGRNLCRPPSATGQLQAALDGLIHTAHGEWCPACRRPLPDCACGGQALGFGRRFAMVAGDR
jgi:hypothetical protein